MLQTEESEENENIGIRVAASGFGGFHGNYKRFLNANRKPKVDIQDPNYDPMGVFSCNENAINEN